MPRRLFRHRNSSRSKGGGGSRIFTSIPTPPAPAPASYIGAALALAFNTLGMSFSSGALAASFTGEPATFSINTLAVSAAAGTYTAAGSLVPGAHFVSTTGSASWADATNSATPCSPATAMLNSAGNDTTYWRGGTYNPDFTSADYEHAAYNPASGSLGLPNLHIAYPGETPIINGNSADISDCAFGANDRTYVTWYGFTGQMGTMAGLYGTAQVFGFWRSTYCIVENCTFIGVTHNNSSSGGNNALLWLDHATSCEVRNCVFRDNLAGGSSGNGLNTCGIWMFTVNSCVIRNCNIYNCPNGIMQKNNNNTLCEIYHNHIHDLVPGVDMVGLAFSLANQLNVMAVGHTIHDNLIRNVGIAFFAGNGDQLVAGYTIYNNTCVNCSQLFEEDAHGWSNLDAYNNIAYQVTGSGVRMDAAQTQSRLDYQQYYDSVSFVWSINYTDYYTLADWRTAVGPYVTTGDEANSAFGDPLFVNAAGTTPADFVLQAGSPCLTNGLGGVRRGVIDMSQVGVQ